MKSNNNKVTYKFVHVVFLGECKPCVCLCAPFGPSRLFSVRTFDDRRHGLNADCVAASPPSPTSLAFLGRADRRRRPELNLETAKKK